MHGNAANGMKDVCSLACFHTNGDWYLKAKSSAIHIWLHLVSLVQILTSHYRFASMNNEPTCCARSKSDFVATNSVGI